MKYNYREAMISDILEYISNEINILDFDSREDLAATLNDDLWVCDSVTGNASGSYTFDRWQAKEYVLDNLDDLQMACDDFCIDDATVGEKFLAEDWEYFDVTIRCWYLGSCIEEALDRYEKNTERVFEY